MTEDDGPWYALARLRLWAGAQYDEDGTLYAMPGTWAEWLTCPRCFSVAAAVAVLFGYWTSPGTTMLLCYPLGLSGAVTWLTQWR